jgi:hypothetical protein
MNDLSPELAVKFAGRALVVLVIEGRQPGEDVHSLLQLGESVTRTVCLEGEQPFDFPAVRLPREQALELRTSWIRTSQETFVATSTD